MSKNRRLLIIALTVHLLNSKHIFLLFKNTNINKIVMVKIHMSYLNCA